MHLGGWMKKESLSKKEFIVLLCTREQLLLTWKTSTLSHVTQRGSRGKGLLGPKGHWPEADTEFQGLKRGADTSLLLKCGFPFPLSALNLVCSVWSSLEDELLGLALKYMKWKKDMNQN